MTDHDPRFPKQERPGDPGQPDHPRPRVRVTDKRRVRPEDPADQSEPVRAADAGTRHTADAGVMDGDTGVAGGSEATEGSRWSEAPPGGAGGPGHHAGDSGLVRAEAEAAEYREHLQRLQAEFDNFRKRTLREQTGALERASEPLMRRLLEVLDEFDLALMAADRTPDFEQFLRGVELVYAKLKDILEAEGLRPIDAVGRPFDPELHEALMHAEGEGDGELVVDDVFRQGYTLKGKVLRPAGVRVTRK
jgi:molecular chaperone GrpE